MNEVLISVVVPTFNRAGFLRRALHSLLRQSFDPASCEIIVVDNNSTDSTAETVRQMAREHAAIRYVFEREQGVSHAKNAGFAAASGRFVAYIDDDALASPNWLRIIADSFQHVRPAPDVVGGPAIPLLVGRRPAWYRDSYETYSWGEVPRFLGHHECFYGLNVAFRRELLAGVGGFDTALGMKGTTLAFAEDNEVFERLWEYTGGGLSAYYTPEAFVRHSIPDSRANPFYWLKREFASGQTGYLRYRALNEGHGFRHLSWATYTFLSATLSAAAGYPQSPRYANWLIECCSPAARQLGYLVAASGVRLNVRRSR